MVSNGNLMRNGVASLVRTSKHLTLYRVFFEPVCRLPNYLSQCCRSPDCNSQLCQSSKGPFGGSISDLLVQVRFHLMSNITWHLQYIMV